MQKQCETDKLDNKSKILYFEQQKNKLLLLNNTEERKTLDVKFLNKYSSNKS